jgi:hypothetical protein
MLDPVRRHTLGVYLAGGLLVATVVAAVLIGGALLFGLPAGSQDGSDIADGPATTAPVPRLAATTTTAGTATTAAPTTATAPPPKGGGALCVGDSVMQSASPKYYDLLTMCSTVDAAVSRQWSGAVGTIRSHSPYPDRVVIHLGTNGFTSAEEVDAVLRPLAKVRRVVLVTVQVNGTRRWESSENVEIAAAATRWPNVRIADWKRVSDGHPEFFRPDRIHPTQAGAIAYANVINNAL